MTFPPHPDSTVDVGDYTPEIARACAYRGAIWLDSVCPTWANEIDTDRLNMESNYACVLGQAGTCVIESIQRTRSTLPYWRRVGWADASYSTTINYLRYVGLTDDSWGNWSTEFGFYIREPVVKGIESLSLVEVEPGIVTITTNNNDELAALTRECKVRWEMLQCAWLEEIAKRRATTTTTTKEIPTA